MERTKFLTIAVIALFILNLATIGFMLLRPPMPPGGRSGMGGPGAVIADRLHLDADQREQFRALQDERHEQLHPLNVKAGDLYTTYYILLRAERVDTARANAISRQIGQNQQAIAQVNFRHFQQLKTICRPGQQADFGQLMGDLTKIHKGSPGPRP
ncbi:MAG: periplasmic heavy metal sensor [Cytophagales bacterium]|nr:MAG: periplasmic heavy metal sensor [Cytophagales bacterium]